MEEQEEVLFESKYPVNPEKEFLMALFIIGITVITSYSIHYTKLYDKLGDVYSLELQVQSDRLVLDFIDLESGVESEARFISVVDSTLQSDLVDLEIVK